MASSFRQGPPVGQDLASERLAAPRGDGAGQLEQVTREEQGARPQVLRRPRSLPNTASTSRASSAGPTPRPTGCAPSVSTGRTRSPTASPTSRSSRSSLAAASSPRTLARGPTGTSTSTWVEPAATFLESTEATSWPGAVELQRPLHADEQIVGRAQPGRAAPDDAATLPLDDPADGRGVQLHRGEVSIVSAVPAGEVMALEEVLGIRWPAAAMIGTITSVVRLPGRPPTECLSSTGARRPREPLTHAHHRAGQIDGLPAVQALARAGGEEGSDVDVGVLAGRHVADDLGEGRGVEPLSVDLGTHVPEGRQRARVPYADSSAGVHPEPGPGRFREPRLPLLEQRRGHDRERRAEAALAGTELDASL